MTETILEKNKEYSVRAYAGTSGVGAAYDIGVGSSFNASYSWNSDGSYTANLSASMSVPLPGVPLWANFGGGYSYNSETGHALTGQMGACAGIGDLLCSGESVGGGLYWSNSEFLGGTAYVEAYASVGGVYGASAGKEWGYGNVAGRGWYMGINAMGVHAGVSSKGGLDWGFEEKVFFGVRSNNSKKVGKDGSAKSIMSWGLQIPTLGELGYLEYDFDFSNGGVKNANDDALERIFADNPELLKQVRDQRTQGNENEYSRENTERFRKGLLVLGYEEVRHKGDHGDGIKFTYRRKGSLPWTWGQIEFVVRPDGTSYASFNYGNNPFTHFMLDWWGYKNRGY